MIFITKTIKIELTDEEKLIFATSLFLLGYSGIVPKTMKQRKKSNIYGLLFNKLYFFFNKLFSWIATKNILIE